jgi:hypothetical protein
VRYAFAAQSTAYDREGIELDVSMLADWVSAAATTLMPLVEAIQSHVLAAERIHADDTTVWCWRRQSHTGRLWTYVRDDRPCSLAQSRRRPASSTRATAAGSIPNATLCTPG